MPRYYTYLISSLPFLKFDKEPPFSFLRFLDKCMDFISEEELVLMKTIPEKEPEIPQIKQKTLKRWFNFDFALRNELIKQRALIRNKEPYKYLRKTEENLSLYSLQIINQAVKNPSPLEAEKMLDRLRWDFLEELEARHFFDFDFLVVYGIKLSILERWDRIQKADKEALLEHLVN
ncbi:MAG: DUF2764 domain-containing protein [Candidatus Omnitrophica bacterium]|nr:DUF2764 domain-containing protein [Candidatus Omnitrophota bacterium]